MAATRVYLMPAPDEPEDEEALVEAGVAAEAALVGLVTGGAVGARVGAAVEVVDAVEPVTGTGLLPEAGVAASGAQAAISTARIAKKAAK